MIEGRLAAAVEQIDEWVGPRGVGGVAVAVWHRGGVIAAREVGDARPGVPVAPDTLFALASVTKPVAAAAVLALIEDGLIALDTPVAEILPGFTAGAGSSEPANPALEARRGEVTVRQLLCHTSGLPEDLAPRDGRYADQQPVAAITDAMLQLPLLSAPGERLRYSNAGYAALARIAERVSGVPFWSLAEDRVLTPLGLPDVVASPGPDVASRLAELADTHHPGTLVETYNSAYWRALALPWGGLFGTTRDLARFAGSFLDPSLGDGFLAPPTRAAMTSDQTGGVPGGVESGKVEWPIGRWGLGWEVKGEKTRHWTGTKSSPRTFCHFGQAGTLVWGDPERDLAVAVFANRAVSRVWGFFLTRWIRLNDAIADALDG